jgi:hypothetical protein
MDTRGACWWLTSIIASTAVITGMIAVIDGGAATSKSYCSYWTTITVNESAKIVPINRVVRRDQRN